MSVVDFLINALIKQLKKTQKVRIKRKRARLKSLKRSRKLARKKIFVKKRKKIFSRRKIKKVKRSSPKVLKPRKARIKKKLSTRPKSKPVRKTPQISRIRSSKNQKPSQEICIGEITHFFSRIQVVVLKMTKGDISIGEEIHIKGKETDFTQNVESLQIESIDVKKAHKGQLVGLKVKKPVKVGSLVYKV
jgi:hypothetical protein